MRAELAKASGLLAQLEPLPSKVGHELHKHVPLTDKDIERWFTNKKLSALLFFTTKEGANRPLTVTRRIEVTIIKKQRYGVIYYVHTVKLD